MSSVFTNKKTVTVLQGEYRVTTDPSVVLSTVLGSCIAACVYDDQNGVGGMNHFLLAHSNGAGAASARYGVHAMELLINGIMKKGAQRRNLQAKVFGGAKMSVNLSDIGAKNTAFIQSFLRDEGIPCISSSVGGTSARRVRFHPVSGAAQQTHVQNDQTLDKIERAAAAPPPPAAPKPAAGTGDVMLF
ncbi:chemotaxis protein CheD [Epibacterium sp. SM1969]|uniref:Probable chemoreceptor glutamine deamidase CheD n=1 Tax=Tritonibacter aquimaris TaxID=2663379 RepID=A0A844B0Q0_9RHOB|nr:chemotaxis protein CheD [Tritonibacter aquimaris]MQY43872.1 chemotaxis protein CheD [Tritonibacter aquimaris]